MNNNPFGIKPLPEGSQERKLLEIVHKVLKGILQQQYEQGTPASYLPAPANLLMTYGLRIGLVGQNHPKGQNALQSGLQNAWQLTQPVNAKPPQFLEKLWTPNLEPPLQSTYEPPELADPWQQLHTPQFETVSNSQVINPRDAILQGWKQHPITGNWTRQVWKHPTYTPPPEAPGTRAPGTKGNWSGQSFRDERGNLMRSTRRGIVKGRKNG